MIYSEAFQAEKSKIIDQLSIQNTFLEKLITNNYIVNIFNTDQLDKLRCILEKNNKFLYKIESDEFEIAIVGLEKAGKSTFANALIESNVLPSAPERCTFTSTRLVSGNDKARVDFYTANEFNEIFQELLKEIEYPEAEKQSFKLLSADAFENYFINLEISNPNLYKNHVGKTDQEIKDIIKCRDKLTLTGDSKEFSGDELESDIFQSYIKGENKGDDTSKPRSVKKIVIESSKLKQLDTAVIYDVPGFDSPTKIHIRQTEERLKQADAIILVTNVGRNPSIQGTSLSVINKNTDADGIALKDKLFVFGNQLDMANNEAEAVGNKDILIKDVEKYKIGERKRIFTGSALKYLVDKKLRPEKFEPKFPIEAGIDNIRAELIHYYETERFDILKRKINTNKGIMQSLFNEVLKTAELKEYPNFTDNEKSKIARATQKLIEKNLKDNLNNFNYELKASIWEEKYFSNKFCESVDDCNYFDSIDEEFITETKISASDSLTTESPCERINQEARKRLHKKFLKDFSILIRQLTNQKSKEIEVALLREFTTSILGSTNSHLFEEVEIESKKVIEKITMSIAHNEDRFAYLIERFSRDIFDVLILNPLISNDRADKFKKAEKEFIYLNNYYKDGKSNLINVILCGEQENSIQIESTIAQLASEALNQTQRLTSIITAGHGTPAIINGVKTLTSILEKQVQNSEQKFNIDTQKITKNKLRSSTEEQVLKEINNDIINLKEILQTAVVPATNLDLAFYNSIDKQVKLLIDAIDLDNQEAFHLFNDFLTAVVNKIKKPEFDNINDRMEAYKLQKVFLNEIKEVVTI